ncbi:MAG: ArnT family glycosyltransferase [Candidatus Omnitrophota bacterium]
MHPLYLIFGLLIETLFLFYKFYPKTPAQAVILYTIVWAAVFILTAIAFGLSKKQPFSRSFALTVILFSLLFGLTLMTTPPDQSDDIYRYIWDGKIQANHINPYTYAPNDPVLAPYHSEVLPERVNFPTLKTIYPPMAQVFFLLSYTLFGESLTGMKFLFLLTACGSMTIFYLLLQRFSGSPRWFLFFAWNPLVIMETAINGHLDILMVFFVLLSLWLFDDRRFVLSGMAAACAVMTKLIPVILLPILFFYLIKNPGYGPRDRITRITHPLYRFVIPLLLTGLGFYALYFSSATNLLNVVLNYSTRWYFNNPLFFALLFIFKTNAAAHMAAFVLFAAVYLRMLLRPFPLNKKIMVAVLAFVVLNPTIHPWYLTILTGLLCLSAHPAIALWSGTMAASYAVVYRYKTTGRWSDSVLWMAIEYLPLLILFIVREWRSGRPFIGFLRQKTSNE